MEIRLRTRCSPTEERDKVVRAILNLFPDAELSGEEEMVGRAGSLDTLREMLKRQRIRDAARSVLFRGLPDDSLHFRLNKQVAAVGKVSFVTEPQPLGDIEVTVSSDNVRGTIDYLTSHEEGTQE